MKPILDVALRSGVGEVHIIAHSMGNRALLSAMHRLAESASQQTGVKFGQVMLEGGTWNGTRIIPRDFARTAGSPLVTLRQQRAGMRYGYLWWTIDYPYKGRTITAYFASGNGGNVVVVVPDADMVIACFGGNYNARAGWAVVTEHIPKYILGAVKK